MVAVAITSSLTLQSAFVFKVHFPVSFVGLTIQTNSIGVPHVKAISLPAVSAGFLTLETTNLFEVLSVLNVMTLLV